MATSPMLHTRPALPRCAEPQRQRPATPARPDRFGRPPRRAVRAARREQGEHGRRKVVRLTVTKWQDLYENEYIEYWLVWSVSR